MKAKDWFLDFSRGAALGTGVLPGVSVGTIGLIVSVYDKLINSINDLRKKFVQSFLTLLPIALGCIIAAVILLLGYSRLTAWRPQAMFWVVACFAGVIIGGLPIVIKEIDWKSFSWRDGLNIGIGFVIAAAIGVTVVILSSNGIAINVENAFLDPNANWWVYPVTFVVGFIAAVACLLPGISGSMVLFIFGVYQPVVHLLTGENSILHNDVNRIWRILLLVILFIGVVSGLFATSKAMGKMMKEHRRGTYTMVLGFIGGSLVSMFINQDMWAIYPSLKWFDLLVGIALLVIAVILIGFLVLKKAKGPAEKPEN